MNILPLVEWLGEVLTIALFGLLTGTVFGIAAQRSRFCLRAAVVEFGRGVMGDRVSVWLLTFSTALVWVQMAQLFGQIKSADARMMAVPGSWSGAIIGGIALMATALTALFFMWVGALLTSVLAGKPAITALA